MLSLGTIVSIACFNSFGIATTKYGSAAQRATIDTSRTVLIWLFFLIVPTSSKETFSWVQLGGFVLLVIGTLLYNEIVVLPVLGFNQNTNAAKARRNKGSMLLDEDEDEYDDKINKTQDNEDGTYMPSSPAHYDYQKNYKHLKDKMGENADKTGDDFKAEGF